LEQAERQEIIDVHCHFFAGQEQAGIVARGLASLRAAGVRHLAVMGLVNPSLDDREVWKLIPQGFPNLGGPLFNEADDLLEFSRLQGAMLFPMLDTRCFTADNVPTLLQGYLQRGFRGIKGLYLGDAENDLGLHSVPATFGITLEQYHRREWEIFAFAQTHDLPVLYHMDARRYGEVMRAILEDFPRLRINFPHFGIGRKAFRQILDRYPNVFTDIAYMLPHIQSDPASYRDFISHYPDRVCFGSDALIYQPEIVLAYIELVKNLGLPTELEAKVFSGNPRRYLGVALG